MKFPAFLLRLKLGPRMALLIVVGAGAVLAAIRYSDYRNVLKLLEELETELRGRALLLATATAREMEVVQRSVENVVEELAVAIETGEFDESKTYSLLESTVKENDEIYGSAVTLLAGGESPENAPVRIPYVYKDADRLVRKDLASGDYPLGTQEWYLRPRETGAPVWTEPYYDEGGGDLIMVTYSVPIHGGEGGRFLGVVTGDLSLDWLEATVARAEKALEEDGGRIFIITRKGTLVAHWDREFILRESIWSRADALQSEELRELGRSMAAGKSDVVEFPPMPEIETPWIAYTPVPGTGWSLGVVFRKEQITARLLALAGSTFPLAGLGALAMIVVALLIARSVSRPIRDLDAAARVLAGGDLDAALPAPRGTDEVARLTESFARMREHLQKYIEDLKETTAAKARIENDLQTARTIQLDLLPNRFTFDPPRPEIEIHAALEPARAVGGDFYDFFFVDRDRIFLAVADVSGKGVPAALFMAVSKAYLKAFALEARDPARALSELNDELALENDEAMFLTVFCAEIDLATGEGRYAIGGHNPPLILRSSGQVEELPQLKGPLVGLDHGAAFGSGSFRLERGDVLLGFSDGVVEAENERNELYGDDRTRSALARLGNADAATLLEGMRQDIRAFVGNAAQADDITLLAFRFLGRE